MFENLTEPIYLDCASTTPMIKEVKEAMLPYFDDWFGNANSNHDLGKKSLIAIDNARESVAELMGCQSSEVYFTSGATEAINWGLKGFLSANPNAGDQIISVRTEHKATLETLKYLEEIGYEISYLNVDDCGVVSLQDLKESVSEKTALVAIMAVNNETGVIQPILEIGNYLQSKGICFFSDTTQAVGKMKMEFNSVISMQCISAHKFNGPKGIGALIVKTGIKIDPLIHGGGQEKGLRGGTYNTPLVVGLGKASEIASKRLLENIERSTLKMKKIITYFEKNKIGVKNFTRSEAISQICSISLNNNMKAEDFLIKNREKFIASTGSACNSSIIEPSHVLKEIGIEKIESVIRLSVI